VSARSKLIAAVLLVLALALRVGQVERTSYAPANDAISYLKLGGEVARFGDYSRYETGAGGSRGPTAYFPPGYPYFVAAADLLDGHSTWNSSATIHGARLANAALGAVTVVLVGLVAFELFGPTIGLVALGVAAVYPVLIEVSGLLLAENLFTALILASVWAVLRARRSARPLAWVAGAGGLLGLATLAHENGIVLVVPLSFAAWTAAERRLKAPLSLVAAAVLMVVPWTIRNAIVMHRFIPVSDETGITLVGTYNSISAHDPRVPYRWRLHISVRPPLRFTEPQLSSKLTSRAFHYIGQHPFAPLIVAYDNTLRMFELAGTFAWKRAAGAIGLQESTAQIGVIAFWVLCLLAIGGAFTTAARSAPRWLWLMPLLLALTVVFVNVETPRFREPIDPFLILPAACALSALAAWLRRAPVGRVRRAPVPLRGGQLVEMHERLA
jgi:4-amino-4-deoxy-L-arabinose transferase-like glycosyltransferase